MLVHLKIPRIIAQHKEPLSELTLIGAQLKPELRNVSSSVGTCSYVGNMALTENWVSAFPGPGVECYK